MSDRRKEVTWQSMPGPDEFTKRAHFALWRRGQLEIFDHIEDPDARKAAQKLDAKKRLMESTFGTKQGRVNIHPDDALKAGRGSRPFDDGRIVASCDDEMAAVKAAARQWATGAFGHDFTQIADAVVEKSRNGKAESSQKHSGFRGTPNTSGRDAAGWTTVAERWVIRERCLAAAAMLRVKMSDICRPAGCTETNFIAPRSLQRSDSINWVKLRAYLPKVESGEVTKLPKRLSLQGSYRIPNPTSLDERLALRERGLRLAEKMGVSFTAMMRAFGCPKSKLNWALKSGIAKDSNYWHPFQAWLEAKEKEVAA